MLHLSSHVNANCTTAYPRWSAGGRHSSHVGRKARLDAFGKMISITEVCNSDVASVEGFKAFYVAKEGNSGGVHVRHNLMSCSSSSSDLSLHGVVATPHLSPKTCFSRTRHRPSASHHRYHPPPNHETPPPCKIVDSPHPRRSSNLVNIFVN